MSLCQLYDVGAVARAAYEFWGRFPAWVASTRPEMPGFYVPLPPEPLPFFDWTSSRIPEFPKQTAHLVEWRRCGGCPHNAGLYLMVGCEPLCWWRFADGVVIESRPERVEI